MSRGRHMTLETSKQEVLNKKTAPRTGEQSDLKNVCRAGSSGPVVKNIRAKNSQVG